MIIDRVSIGITKTDRTHTYFSACVSANAFLFFYSLSNLIVHNYVITVSLTPNRLNTKRVRR